MVRVNEAIVTPRWRSGALDRSTTLDLSNIR
jgi:hypothetical protein